MTKKTMKFNDYKPAVVIALPPAFIVNVGSVGQLRDGNSDAKYVIFDYAADTVDLRYVKYDIDKKARLIEERNFPKYNAERLYQNWIEVLG